MSHFSILAPSELTPAPLQIRICALNWRSVDITYLLPICTLMVSQTRMVHTKPAELLLPDKGLSKPTEKMLAHFTEYVGLYCQAYSETLDIL